MKFKIDENLPAEVAADLAAAGHDAETVASEGLAGFSDERILDAARVEGRVVLTLDKGVANLRVYPAGSYSGIVLFRPKRTGRGAVLAFVRSHLAVLMQLDLTGRLLIIT